MNAKPKPSFAIGDRVALSAAFLRAIGDYSYESGSKRGAIVDLPYGAQYASIVWEGFEQNRGLVLVANLIHADKIHLEPN